MLGYAMLWPDDTARNSNLLPVKGNGLVRFRWPASRGSFGRTETPVSMMPPDLVVTTKSGGIMDTGVSVLPKLPRDAGQRNRTSPFPFTGNKFEFRAVSSGQSIAYPNIALNVAVTESLDYIATELEKATKSGKSIEQAVADLLPKVIKENKRIIFNGNNYSAEWEK